MKITHKITLPMCIASYMTLCNESYIDYQDLKTWCKLLSTKLSYKNREVQTQNSEEDFKLLSYDKVESDVFVLETHGVALRKNIDYLRDHYMAFFDTDVLMDLFKLADKYLGKENQDEDENEI
ncbi:MAG: hypothetical protein J6A28_04620 [Clostridia bacterium]|nr:hypothetical protein [Clostridia bacterium]